MQFKFETHCHSKYSHDSNMSMSDIVDKCLALDIKGIVICDHDIIGITEEDEKLFWINGIHLYKAIEFTTCEDVHIIGVHNNIKSIQNKSMSYKAIELVDAIMGLGGYIIIPHPETDVGVFNKRKINSIDRKYILSHAHYIEKSNYYFGDTENIEDVLSQYQNLKPLASSDAHSKECVAAYYNEVNITENNINGVEFNIIHELEIMNVKRIQITEKEWVWTKFWRRRIANKFYAIGIKLCPKPIQKSIKWFVLKIIK